MSTRSQPPTFTNAQAHRQPLPLHQDIHAFRYVPYKKTAFQIIQHLMKYPSLATSPSLSPRDHRAPPSPTHPKTSASSLHIRDTQTSHSPSRMTHTAHQPPKHNHTQTHQLSLQASPKFKIPQIRSPREQAGPNQSPQRSSPISRQQLSHPHHQQTCNKHSTVPTALCLAVTTSAPTSTTTSATHTALPLPSASIHQAYSRPADLRSIYPHEQAWPTPQHDSGHRTCTYTRIYNHLYPSTKPSSTPPLPSPTNAASKHHTASGQHSEHTHHTRTTTAEFPPALSTPKGHLSINPPAYPCTPTTGASIPTPSRRVSFWQSMDNEEEELVEGEERGEEKAAGAGEEARRVEGGQGRKRGLEGGKRGLEGRRRREGEEGRLLARWTGRCVGVERGSACGFVCGYTQPVKMAYYMYPTCHSPRSWLCAFHSCLFPPLTHLTH